MDVKNVTLTNITEKQRCWLRNEARKKALTITGFVKLWIEAGIKKNAKKEKP